MNKHSLRQSAVSEVLIDLEIAAGHDSALWCIGLTHVRASLTDIPQKRKAENVAQLQSEVQHGLTLIETTARLQGVHMPDQDGSTARAGKTGMH